MKGTRNRQGSALTLADRKCLVARGDVIGSVRKIRCWES